MGRLQEESKEWVGGWMGRHHGEQLDEHRQTPPVSKCPPQLGDDERLVSVPAVLCKLVECLCCKKSDWLLGRLEEAEGG